jgi:hypothetical protein
MDKIDKNDKKKRLNPDGDDRYAPGQTNSVPGINTPEISLPAFNPPVPNRAWTAMKNGKDIDELTEEEKRMLYYGKDGIL